MRVSRRAGAEDFQRQITGAGDAMRRAGRDANGIAGYHVELIGAKCHAARALRDVINLFRAVVFVQLGLRAGHDGGFGQALRAAAECGVLCRMHQLADLRTVLGDEGSDAGVCGFRGLHNILPGGL